MTEKFGPAYWERRYHDSVGHGSPRPNPQLVAEVADLGPGTALDAGCGEGGNALWLAEQGWHVTAVDVSPSALRSASRQAANLGGDIADRVEWLEEDLTVWEPPREAFGLVTSHYVHPTGTRDGLLVRLAAAVAPGGTLLIVDHDHSDEHAHAHASPGELAAGLPSDRWTIEVAESRNRSATGHRDEELILRDSVLRARLWP